MQILIKNMKPVFSLLVLVYYRFCRKVKAKSDHLCAFLWIKIICPIQDKKCCIRILRKEE